MTATQTLEAQPAVPARRRFTLEEFFRMGELGFFDDQRVELVDGEVYVLPPQGYRHAKLVRRLSAQLGERFRGRAQISSQLPVILDSPVGIYVEPDVALIQAPESRYDNRHVRPEDIYLVIEVSDSTLERDRAEKSYLYASNGVPEYWIVNLQTGQLEMYRDPRESMLSEGGEVLPPYRSVTYFDQGQAVASLAFPDVPLEWWEAAHDG